LLKVLSNIFRYDDGDSAATFSDTFIPQSLSTSMKSICRA